MQTMAYAYTSVAGVSVPDPSKSSGAFHRRVPAEQSSLISFSAALCVRGNARTLHRRASDPVHLRFHLALAEIRDHTSILFVDKNISPLLSV